MPNTRTATRWHNRAPRRQVGQRPDNDRTGRLLFATLVPVDLDDLFGPEML